MYSKVKNKHSTAQGKTGTDSSNNEDEQQPCTSTKSSSVKKKSSKSSHKKTCLGNKTSKQRTVSECSEDRSNSVKFLSDNETDENNDINVENSMSVKSPGINVVFKKVAEDSSELDTKYVANSPVPSPCYRVLPENITRQAAGE